MEHNFSYVKIDVNIMKDKLVAAGDSEWTCLSCTCRLVYISCPFKSISDASVKVA